MEGNVVWFLGKKIQQIALKQTQFCGEHVNSLYSHSIFKINMK